MICPDCEGKGTVIALVDGIHYCGPMCVSCSRCNGTGEADPQTEGWLETGGTHQMPAELSAMENRRVDPVLHHGALPRKAVFPGIMRKSILHC